MSFDLPLPLERELEQYALAEHMSTSEAAVKLIEFGLRAREHHRPPEITEADLQTLRDNDPMFSFLDSLPDELIESIEQASRETRAEHYHPRE